MSIYPPSSPHRRQAPTASTSSLNSLSNYSFPPSRSTTVTSVSSLSSRFSSLESRPGTSHQQTASVGTPMLSAYTSNLPSSDPSRPGGGTPTPPPLRHSSPLASQSSRHLRGKSVPPPTALAASPPFARPSPTPSPYNSANRSSVIVGTSSLRQDDINQLRNSSVSHMRTLSRVTQGSAEEFGIDAGQDVAGMHGRKRLQRAATDNMTSWERMTWMDKRRQYIQAYEYLCHIGEAKEYVSLVQNTCFLLTDDVQMDGGLHRGADSAYRGARRGAAGRCCSCQVDEGVRPGTRSADIRVVETAVSTFR